PTGTVTFTFYRGGNCTSGTAETAGTVSLDSNGVADPSSAKGPLSAAGGPYAFKADYNGEGPNHEPATNGREPLAGEKADAGTSTVVHNASHVDKTNGSVGLGSVMHDTATVTGGVSGFATPTPSFTLTSSYVDSCASGAAVANNGTESGAAKSADSAPLHAGD